MVHQKFASLYDNYFDDVYRYIYFKTGNKWDTDDLVSEAFRKACEKYDSSIRNEKAWLFMIVRNSVIDYYRKRKDVLLEENIDLYTYPSAFEQEFEKKENIKCLKNALDRLSQEESEIINLKYFADMKYKDIGKLLGKSDNAVKMKTARIIKKLKDLMNQ